MSLRVAERRGRVMDEIVAAALAVMAEDGAAGLSLGAVASRLGMRTPSLYGYFPSKAALCDEIFARGWRDVADALAPLVDRYRHLPPDADLAAEILAGLECYVGWALDHAPSAELMFWRPIPGWHPSEQAFGAAVATLAQIGAALTALQDRGVLRRDADPGELTGVLTILGAGVISQHLSNEPGAALAEGRHASHLPVLAQMFARQYGAVPPP